MATDPHDPHCVVMDFFAGSGSTAHAVVNQNLADGGKRRFVLVQLPEPLSEDSADQQIAAAYCVRQGVPKNIASLTRLRLKRVHDSQERQTSPANIDTGFRSFRLSTSNIKGWAPDRTDIPTSIFDHLEHVLANRSDSDVLYELLLKLGLDLCVPIESKDIAGKSVKSIGGGVLLACLDEQITVADAEPLALGIVAWVREQQPAGEVTCVFRDSAFDGSDVAKTNLAAILEQHGIAKVRSL